MIDDRFVFDRDSGTTIGKEAFVQRAAADGRAVGSRRAVLVEGDTASVFATTDLRIATKPDAVSSFRCAGVYVRRGRSRDGARTTARGG